MRFEVADNRCVGDVLVLVRWDVVVVYDMECVGPISPLANALGTYTNDFAQAAHLVGVRGGPDGRKSWVLAELAACEVISSLIIKDRHCPYAE